MRQCVMFSPAAHANVLYIIAWDSEKAMKMQEIFDNFCIYFHKDGFRGRVNV